MQQIRIEKSSLSLYCDKIFIHKMASLRHEPILDEKFITQAGEIILIDMFYLAHDDIDKIEKYPQKITLFWCEDSLSIFELNATNLNQSGYLYTSELNYVTNAKNKNIYVYLFLNKE